MLVDRGAQVVHHALADLVREQRLDHAENARPDRDSDHRGDEDVEQAQVAVRERVVEDALHQEGRDRADDGREDDQTEDGGEPESVGLEEADDPPQVGASDGLVSRTFDRLGRLEGATAWHRSQTTDRVPG